VNGGNVQSTLRSVLQKGIKKSAVGEQRFRKKT
jgi:hypothetical protein